MGNTLCGSIVVIAIANAHTPDDAIDSFSLKFLMWFKLSVAVDRNAVPRCNAELDAPCCLWQLICSWYNTL